MLAETSIDMTSRGNAAPPSVSSNEGVNERLNTEHLNLDPNDNSHLASLTRFVAGIVGRCCTPYQIIVVMRVLKAVTFCVLMLNIAADIMYIVFVDIIYAKYGNGWQIFVLRCYGAALSTMAVTLELDLAGFVKNFPGLKRFIPRSLFLFFIATITDADLEGRTYNQNDDDNDRYQQDDQLKNYLNDVPMSAIVFQATTSWILTLCACCYFSLGLLCCDRFTSKAFVSARDHIATTQIIQTAPSAELVTPYESHYG
mmetsp:Transcript_48937/g.59017  ORF Transcript_48937/g.59017 Transcript_48937/m.59017 type:complete len:256 (-) Transcript_48937:823-1590(-)